MPGRPEDLDDDGGFTEEYLEKYETARADLEKAIRAFIDVVDPNEFVLHWGLVVHKTSIALEQNSMSAVGVHYDTDISFVEKRGLVETMRDALVMGA